MTTEMFSASKLSARAAAYMETEMVKPDIITTPSGDRLAILPLAEYERLVDAAEMTADVAAYEEFHRRLSSGTEELIPAAFADRIIDGESKIKVRREFRNLSARELAEKAGISAAFLSQIESGARDGSFDTIKKIAAALGITVDELA
jgi:DNA-binding XRE family transcriptional regulator